MKKIQFTTSANCTGMHAIMATIVAVTLFFTACHSDDNDFNQLPQPIAEFVSTYYPGVGVESYSHSADTYHVRVSSGPGMTFGADYAWEAIDGYGMPLPQVMLFDQLPPKLYAYLQDSEQLNSVFSMSRDSKTYTLTLLQSSLYYDIASGEITGS